MTLHMNLPAGGYDIVLERGVLSRAGALLSLDRKVLIVTDDGVPARYAEALAAQCASPLLFTLPQGEASKSLESLKELLSAMLSASFTRGDCVLAVGGGVVGDLAGFAASCYMRGIDFYNVPTTVLAQADSSIGGKCAVNLNGIKNCVGAFYQPAKVLIDPDTCRTLPRRQFAAGLAEIIKAGLIADGALFARFEDETDEERLTDVLAASLLVKKKVVEEDEREQGLRRILNFGHTIGHGIESVTGLLHGECVALGMLPMCAPDVRKRLKRVLEHLSLPTEVRADPEAVYEAMCHDKKRLSEGLHIVCVETAGACVQKTVAPETLRPAIEMVVKP